MASLKEKTIALLRWSEKYTKTDMVYLLKGSFWLNANTIIVTALSFALSIAFARLVPKETYGIYQFIISLSAIIGSLTLTGMNTAVTQAVARGFEGVFPRAVRLQIKYGLIPFLAGLAISLYYLWNKNSDISISLIVIAIALPLTNALNTWTAFLSGKKDFEGLFRYAQIINVVYYVGIIAVVFYIPNALVLIILNFVLNAVSNLMVYKLVIKRYQPNINLEEKALDFGKKFSLSNVLPMIALNIDNIIVFHFLGAASLAVYAFASNIPERLGSLLRPISAIALPKLSEKNKSELQKAFSGKLWQLFNFTFIFWILYVVASPFLFKMFFPQYMASIFYSQIYALTIILGTFSGLFFAGLSSVRSNAIFKFNIINPIFNIVVIFITVHYWGIWGAVIGKVVSNAFQAAISWYFLKISLKQI